VTETEEVKAVLGEAQEKQKKATKKLIALLNQDALDVKEILESIKSGGDLNAKNKNNQTALYLAAKNGYTYCAEELIKAKENVNGQDNYGYTPLHYAAKNEHLDIVKILLEKVQILMQETKMIKRHWSWQKRRR
jgi:ankyrin repeat protein